MVYGIYGKDKFDPSERI